MSSSDLPTSNIPPTPPSTLSNGNSNGNNNENDSDSDNEETTIIDSSLTNTTNTTNTITNTIIDSSLNNTIFDISYSVTYSDLFTHDASCDDISLNIGIPPIVNFSLNETINGTGYSIQNQQGVAADGSKVTLTLFNTTDASLDTQITENLGQIVTTYTDTVAGSRNDAVLRQIQQYAAEIDCSDFHGKGSIDDYENLFHAAAKIANETKQIELNVNIDGFNEFAQAADDLSQLFSGFIIKLQQVNIIDDYVFLTAISNALGKIVNLSNIFGKFKETILATTSVQIPKSAHETSIVIQQVMGEINCAMEYIHHFVDSSYNPPGLVNAELSVDELNVITKAVSTIDNWNILCQQGVSISLQNDPAMQIIAAANQEFSVSTNTLKTATSNLKSKLAKYSLC
jgi:hypothetical protein